MKKLIPLIILMTMSLQGFSQNDINKSIQLKKPIAKLVIKDLITGDGAKEELSLLSKKGSIIIEVQYLLNTLKDLTFDNIYHEHFNYWSLTSLINFFKNFKIKIYKAEKINTHGGSLRIYLKKDKNVKIDKSVSSLLKEEEEFGMKKFKTYQIFGEKVYNIRSNVIKNIKNLKKKQKKNYWLWSASKSYHSVKFLRNK